MLEQAKVVRRKEQPKVVRREQPRGAVMHCLQSPFSQSSQGGEEGVRNEGVK